MLGVAPVLRPTEVNLCSLKEIQSPACAMTRSSCGVSDFADWKEDALCRAIARPQNNLSFYGVADFAGKKEDALCRAKARHECSASNDPLIVHSSVTFPDAPTAPPHGDVQFRRCRGVKGEGPRGSWGTTGVSPPAE